MTQGVTTLGYAAIRGFGPSHPTVGELRCGMVDVYIDDPLATTDVQAGIQASGQGEATFSDASDGEECDDAQRVEDDSYYVGSVPVTEVESVFALDSASKGKARMLFEVGYGLVIGHQETKAIAMSILDFCLNQGDKRFPTQDEEFVLYHVDGVEATGFVSHLKLPHYVTFQSKLSSVRSTVAREGE